jgi:hypothetical protein
MKNEKIVMGQLLVDVFAFTELSNQEFKGQFENFVQARITLTMPNGEERSFAIGEVLETQFESFYEDGIEIQEAENISF